VVEVCNSLQLARSVISEGVCGTRPIEICNVRDYLRGSLKSNAMTLELQEVEGGG
jgi:hypothetical protein